VTREAGVGGGQEDRNPRNRENRMLSGSLGNRIEANLESLLERTRELLEANRLEVLAVAHALEQFKTITGEDIVAILAGNQGPFIDGSRYHTETFREVAEEYHRKIVEAHESRSPDHIEFPVLPGLAREPVDVVGAYADREAPDPTH
jgi:cell division protease FtsH